MPEYRHPSDRPPARVHVSRGERATVDEDGVFTAPERVARAVADQHGVALSDMAVDGEGDKSDTCEVVKADGEVCGRDLPCPYHSEGDA